MKFLCDVHISYKLVHFLNSKGFIAIHVNSILEGSITKDIAIAEYADEFDLILVSKDSDFRLSYLIRKKPRKLVKVNLGNISNKMLVDIFEKKLDLIKTLDLKPTFLLEMGLGSQFYIE